MAKNKKTTPGRNSKRLSKSSKPFKGKAQIEHLNGKSLQHWIDVGMSKIWQETYLSKVKKIKAAKLLAQDGLDEAGFEDAESGPIKRISFKDYLEDASLVKNLCKVDGKWKEMEGDDFTDFLVQKRQERLVYKSAHGSINKPPKQRATDAEKSKYTEPLKITFSRLPPWIALALNSNDPADEKLVKKVMKQFADAVEKETGLPVISANSHRESPHDLHIHLVQSIVVSETINKKIPIKEQARLLAPTTKKLRALMQATKNPTHAADAIILLRDELDINAQKYRKLCALMQENGNSTHPKHVKIVRDALGMHAPTHCDDVTWKRILRHGSKDTGWPIAPRKLKVLGTPYRCKASIYDAATSAADKEDIRTAHEVDFPGNFTNTFVAKDKPEDEFIDYWSEKLLAELVTTSFTLKQKKLSAELKQKSVASYIAHKSTILSPEDLAMIAAAKETIEEIEERELAVSEREASVADAAKATVEELEGRELAVELKEQVAAADVETMILVQETAIEVELAGIEEERESVREEGRLKGRQEFKDAVMAILPESDGEKTDEQAIAKVMEVTGKARLLDKAKPMIKDVLNGVSRLPGLPKRLAKRISKLRDLLFPGENTEHTDALSDKK